ncbi:ATP-binding cassette domain-containing protein [Erwinia sp. CPCC 100877]|nr:ATP-binding cassette domain-containing protein [Erwinia sp. CPCC 100877]
MSEKSITFKNVQKKFEQTNNFAVDNLNFSISEGEFVTILGSSGSGKTTTMKMINRLIEPDAGEIEIYGKSIQSIDKYQLRRDMGYVVQQIGLFPHYTIEKNIATVPELNGWDKNKITDRILELMDIIKLPYDEYAHRYPKQLSGGQQQRIGVARALAVNPRIMLLDEPFGALDAITRTELQIQLKSIHQQLGNKTFLLITHDINEAFYLGTKVMIMREGKIDQFDTPEAIIKMPKTSFVKDLLNTVANQEKFWRGYQ